MFLTDLIGWVGAFLLLLAYFLLIHKDLTSRSRGYQILNIAGALFLGVSTFAREAYPTFVTNMAWVIIGLYGMFHITKNRKSKAVKRK
ncbi:hypothetical protein J4416_01910 [Candidatus Pacearchaeota archaeon]|nr:hypothetical protein [Candidatus Pacearchaeota archaeon]